jgi:GNAT superfamily N-acetyltransferase
MDWRVRSAVVADAAAVRAVAASAWRDTCAGLLKTATIEGFIDRSYSIERLEWRIARHTFLVVEAGDRVVAFADAVEEPDRLNLVAIYVLPEVRGQGAGTLLLESLRARFPRLPIAADVLTGNRKGEIFYERRGFRPRETLEAELFGEPVVERRWWLDVSPTSSQHLPDRPSGS